MFSGEEASYRYATERVREIISNTPFCILAATQAPFAARLVTTLDQGHGVLDRLIITFPKCLRPTPQETEQAVEALTQSPLSSFDDIFSEIARLHASHASYTLSSEAHRILNTLNKEFIADANEAITEGRILPKTKKIDIILRVAASLHIFNHVTTQLRQKTQPTKLKNQPFCVPLNMSDRQSLKRKSSLR